MKQEQKIKHELKGFDAFCISPDRATEISVFLNDLVNEANEKRYKKSHIMERIIDFADTTLEAVAMTGFMFGGQRPKEIIIKKMSGGDDLPDEVIKDVVKELSRIEKTFHRPETDASKN